MFVDLSHVSFKVMHDVLDIAEAPGMEENKANIFIEKSVQRYLIG